VSVRLFLHVASVEMRKRMSYRADFWINAFVGFAAELAVAWFLWTALYAESGKSEIGGYDFDTMLVYYVFVIVFSRLVRGTEFEANVSQDIYDGGLNRYLVFPSSYIGIKYAQHIGGLGPTLVQTAVFVLVWLLATGGAGGESITLAGVLMCAAALALANLLYYAMSYPLHATAFWADNVWSLLVALRFLSNLLGGRMFPLVLFPLALRHANEWLPFRTLFALPVEALLGRVSFETWLQGMAIGAAWLVILAGIARAVWRRGNVQYSGIGM
jgi:ABC-2 type transport system permease protein